MNETRSVTPANDIVELHPTVLADVDGNHFAPEQEAFHQHPGEGGHEEEMQQRRHDVAGDLQVHREEVKVQLPKSGTNLYMGF